MRFILIDEIVELVPGRHIKAIKSISGKEDFFQDHFPGFPVVPGVLLTEMMAQAAGKCLDAEGNPRGKAILVQIHKASFREWMRPQQTAWVVADIKTNRDHYASAACHIEIQNKAICSAELFFSFMPIQRFAKGFRDEVLETYLDKKK
jgi:3-hydroxyacyl-[acyl-carrier-protein] dehydratase